MKTRFLSLALAFLALGAIGACAGNKKPERARAVMPTVRDIPSPLRGTIASEAIFEGINATLVTGYGFVVGLNGTGGGPLTEAVAGTVERMMALRGISRGGRVSRTVLELPDGRGVTPRELLRNKDTAVVVVYAQIPPGAPKGMTFDVFVQALNATSLESGRLWTTEMQIGRSEPYKGPQKRIIAESRGDILVNPFDDPADPREDLNLDIGRVLAGGVLTQPLDIAINLDNPSHSRARAMATAINSRFPAGPGDRTDTARGRNDSVVTLTIPTRFRNNPGDFVKMVQHMPIDIRIPPEIHAQRLLQSLEGYPNLFQELMWSLRALGTQAIPEIRNAYDASTEIVRLTALRAGAYLGDPRAADALIELVQRNPNLDVRLKSAEMLRHVDGGPRVDAALRRLLDDPEPLVRIEAYESLAQRAERAQLSRMRNIQGRQLASMSASMSEAELHAFSRLWLPGDGMYGIRRRLIDDKFLLDSVDAGTPMIYFRLQDEPRIVVMGDARLRKPMIASAWDDRLLIVADSPGEPARLLYRDYRSDRVTTSDISDSLTELIEFLGHTPTPESPEPGLGLSYSEIIGVLHALVEGGATDTLILSEQDRLLRELLEAGRSRVVEDRPEREGDDPSPYRLPMPDLPGQESAPARDGPRIVPLRPSDGLGEGT